MAQALNYASTAFPANLSSPASSSGSISVGSMPGTWPAAPFKILVDWGLPPQEVAIVTAVSGSGPFTFTCTRGTDGTTAQAHSSGAIVVHGFASEDFGQAAAMSTTVWNPRDPRYGAKGTAVQVSDGAITASASTLACTTSTPFTSAAVNVGQVILVAGAGAAGADLVTTISGFTDTGHVTLTASAGTTVTAAAVTFGTDDTSALQAALSAAVAAGGGSWYLPAGKYLTTSSLAVTSVGNGMHCHGDGLASLIIPTGSYDVLSFTSGTGLTVREMQVSSAVSAPTTGAALSINSVADYRVENFSSYGTYWGGYTTGGTGKTSNWIGCYVSAFMYGLYVPGSVTILGCHFGGGSIGAILDDSGGHSVRMVRVGLYGPLSLTTRNSGAGANPNKTVWLQAVECNYQAGTNPPEGPGGMNLDWSAGDIHIHQCWCAGTGLTIGGNTAPTWVDIVGGVFSGNSDALANGIHLKAGNEISITGALCTGSADHTLYDDILIESAVTGPVTVTGVNFSGNSRYNINSAATTGPISLTGNAYAGYSAAQPVNVPSGSLGQYTIIGGGYPTTIPSAVAAGVATLTDAATVAVNAALGNYFRLTLGGNRTMGAPSNPTDGQTISFAVKQDATGSRTLAWNAAYVFPTAAPAPTLSTAAGAVDEVAFRYDGSASVWRCLGYLTGYAS